MNFYPETVPPATKLVVQTIKNLPQLQDFYLSGGTALSLQLGHRESEDLDFFTKRPLNPLVLQQKLLQFGRLENVSIAENTLNLYLDSVKLQFLYYPYTLLEDFQKWENLRISSIIDIACTKLLTISSRGSKKDFIDLYCILQQFSLDALFIQLEEKYKNVEYNYPHILKSLVYFVDAEAQPMPKMHIPLAWEEVKKTITDRVKKISL